MDKIEKLLMHGVDEIIVKESLEKKLKSGKQLIVKLGIDPTGSELHLGHAVVLRKLREFQNLGHLVCLVIGDFTAKIGDPSGRTQERKSLTDEQIRKNMESYKEQATKILDLGKAKFVYNSSWLEKLGMQGVFNLASKATLAQIMERKEFKERVNSKVDVPYLEMFYPLMQGYDSVHLKADVELGGTDQKFNLLMGRQIQKRYDQKEQDLVIMKLLPGTDGSKMSKSANNFIPLMADPFDMYGKIMSIDDSVMPLYFELCTDLPLDNISESKNPLELKKKLAKAIVEIYHGSKASEKADANFQKVFQEGKYQENQSIETIMASGSYKPIEIIINSGTTTSSSQAKDLIRNGALEIDGNKLEIVDWSEEIKLKKGQVIKIGKRRIIKVN